MGAPLSAKPREDWTATAPTPFERIAAALGYREAGVLFPLDEARSRLRVGLCSSLSRGLLREMVKARFAADGAPELSLLEGAPSEIARAVRRGEIDIGLVCGLQDRSGLRAEELWREPLFALVPERHPLARGVEIDPIALRGEVFLAAGPLSDSEGQHALIERVLGGPPAALRRLDVQRETLIHLVGLDFGVALAPSSSLGAFYPGVAYRPLAGPAATIPFHAVWREGDGGGRLGPVLAALRALAGRLAVNRAAAAWAGSG